MGKKWDCDVPKKEIWEQVFRVLKPGGHLIAFFGSRTYHRGAVEIEDAGFEIRDQIMWIYGSGFPKSLDISKEIDKMEGTWRGKSTQIIERTVGQVAKGTEYVREEKGEPISDDAKKWSGWGTNLKPAHEPIVLARKPVEEDTITENVLKYGTGGLNIDESRVGTEGATKRSHQESYGEGGRADQGGTQAWRTGHDIVELNMGRFPANVLHDGSEEVLENFPYSKDGVSVNRNRNGDEDSGNTVYGSRNKDTKDAGYGGEGSAARFFYCAKSSPSEKKLGITTKTNLHPTVKPIKLMEYLVNMITPKGGTVLDPFMGSGSTGIAAAIKLDFNFIGIELSKEYFDIANERLTNLQKEKNRLQDLGFTIE